MFGQMRKKVLWACVTLGLSAFAIRALFYNGGFSFDAGSANVWDVKSGMLVRSFNIRAPTLGSKRNCCDISPDGRYLI